jgi:hypothetical protein
MSNAQTRLEKVNGRFKKWGILKQTDHHHQSKHHLCFEAAAAITQLEIKNSHPPFQVADCADPVLALVQQQHKNVALGCRTQLQNSNLCCRQVDCQTVEETGALFQCISSQSLQHLGSQKFNALKQKRKMPICVACRGPPGLQISRTTPECSMSHFFHFPDLPAPPACSLDGPARLTLKSLRLPTEAARVQNHTAGTLLSEERKV